MRLISAGGAATDVTDRAARILGIAQPGQQQVGTYGIVQPWDWWLLKNTQTYGRGGLMAGVVVGANIQVYNPPASGTVVVVVGIAFAADLTTRVLGLSLYDVALITDLGAGYNLNDGSAPAVAHIRTQDVAGPLGNVLAQGLNAAPTDLSQLLPVRLSSGQGLVLYGNAATQYYGFRWLEGVGL